MDRRDSPALGLLGEVASQKHQNKNFDHISYDFDLI